MSFTDLVSFFADVVKAGDLSRLANITGVQAYTINSSKVGFFPTALCVLCVFFPCGQFCLHEPALFLGAFSVKASSLTT